MTVAARAPLYSKYPPKQRWADDFIHPNVAANTAPPAPYTQPFENFYDALPRKRWVDPGQQINVRAISAQTIAVRAPLDFKYPPKRWADDFIFPNIVANTAPPPGTLVVKRPPLYGFVVKKRWVDPGPVSNIAQFGFSALAQQQTEFDAAGIPKKRWFEPFTQQNLTAFLPVAIPPPPPTLQDWPITFRVRKYPEQYQFPNVAGQPIPGPPPPPTIYDLPVLPRKRWAEVFVFPNVTAQPYTHPTCIPIGCRFDVYDYLDGSFLLAWGVFTNPAATSYNVYVNGVLNQTVTGIQCIVTGLAQTTYNAAAVAPTPPNGPRPQNMPPNGVVTDSQTYDLKVVAVLGGVEQSATIDAIVTVSPTSIMLTTPMKRLWPFPNTGLD
jgi:hypothetical protein